MLYTDWETLDARRNKHKLVLFYKMYNDLTPPYLSSLVPPLVQNVSRYNLRNSNNTQTVNLVLFYFTILFYPHQLETGTDLILISEMLVRTLDSLKHKLNQNLPVIPTITTPE